MHNVTVELNVPCKVRDGVTLRANVYRPAAEGKYPALLARLPYGKDIHPWWNLLDPVRAAAAGYVVIAQDCRGRFASEGDFAAFVSEAEDGYDAVEWAAALPYCDGNVGMFGGSYYGHTQWAAAMLKPPHLKAIAPAITWSSYADGVAYRGGALELGKVLWWNLMTGVEVVRRKLTDAGLPPAEAGAVIRKVVAAVDGLGIGGYKEVPLASLPTLREIGLGLAEIIGGQLAVEPAALGDIFSVRHADVEVPSLNISGWHDICSQGTIDNFLGMRAQGKHAHLLMGPWSHVNYTNAVGEMDFGLAASAATIGLALDLTQAQLHWFDRWLKGKENGVEQEPAARVFVTGENRWRMLPDWPPAGAQAQPWFLHAGGGLAPTPAAADAAASRYRYDPNDPVPTLGGALLMSGSYIPGVRDQRPLSARTDVLTFQSEPLAEPVACMGRISATLWAASSAPDTDFVVRLVDVHPDGFMQNLTDGIIRARYRHSLTEPEWLTPGEPTELAVDMWSVAHVFQPGHRVAVQVTSSSFPRWDRNLNTTAAPGHGEQAEVADQTLFHDADRPSVIHLPIVAI